MGTQKNRLNEMVLLSTQNICLNVWVRKYLKFYAENFCLSKPVVAVCYRYSTGEVKYWDLTSGDTCVLQPSNTSLRLLDDYEGGTVQNTLQSVVTSDSTIAALYSQGKT